MGLVSSIVRKRLREHMHHEDTIAVFLVNGIKLKGVIDDFDDDCVLLGNQLVMMHAISTIQPE